MGLCNQLFRVEMLSQSSDGESGAVFFVHQCIREAHDSNVKHYSKYWPLGEEDR